MRLIDADAAKNEYLAAMKDLLKATTSNLSDNAISLLAGYSIMDNAPTITLGQWIKTSKRRPDFNRWVLGRYKSGSMVVCRVTFVGDDDCCWESSTDDEWCADMDYEPEWWMLLPEDDPDGEGET